ncbi:SRPBCC family protein [Amycolatopsis benzoatilytica]|uniref:SRPBCC family protein n=1 Tax=Amycolatopsis benzoatilytica TaxID=346045 RepID=UPI000373F09E|nr:SRPBCC family protein [Amycolatopsis benzoatilytica]
MNPDASGDIEVKATPEQVYALVSDPGALAGVTTEYCGHRWLGGATGPAVGARFRGTNRRGIRRWSTTVTVTAADEGRRFAFDVALGPIPVSRWEYLIEPAGDGCRITESMWDTRPGWFAPLTVVATGVKDRSVTNRVNIEQTLARVKHQLE